MRGGRRARAARLQSVCSHLQPSDRLHVLQTLENRLTPALPVEVGLKGCCLGVAHRLASAVLVVVSSPDNEPPALVSHISIKAKFRNTQFDPFIAQELAGA